MTIFPSRSELVERSGTEDYTTFCGSGSAPLRLHERLRGPVWSAFLFSFAWFYWRRLYLVGSLMLMPAILIADLDIQAGTASAWSATLVIGLILLPPVMARRCYATAFLQRCDRADQLGLSGADRLTYLARSGGTSWLAGLLAGALWLSFATILLRAFLSHDHTGFSS